MEMKKEMAMKEPCICDVSVAAKNILLITVQQGKVSGGIQMPYRAEEGESLEQDRQIPSLVYIIKDGRRIGVKVEDRQFGTRRFPFKYIVGEKLDVDAADDPESYRVNGLRPLRVYRKTKPNNIADPYNEYTYRHCIYLVCDSRFEPGADIELAIRPGLFDREKVTVCLSPGLRSEAIHVNQLGYRPDDPSKKAYLSCWMGLGGGVSYDDIREFFILDEKDRQVFQGSVTLQHTGEIVPIGKDEISSLCPIYEMDFSDFSGEGVFRVFLPELGCSFPFRSVSARGIPGCPASGHP